MSAGDVLRAALRHEEDAVGEAVSALDVAELVELLARLLTPPGAGAPPLVAAAAERARASAEPAAFLRAVIRAVVAGEPVDLDAVARTVAAPPAPKRETDPQFSTSAAALRPGLSPLEDGPGDPWRSIARRLTSAALRDLLAALLPKSAAGSTAPLVEAAWEVAARQPDPRPLLCAVLARVLAGQDVDLDAFAAETVGPRAMEGSSGRAPTATREGVPSADTAPDESAKTHGEAEDEGAADRKGEAAAAERHHADGHGARPVDGRTAVAGNPAGPRADRPPNQAETALVALLRSIAPAEAEGAAPLVLSRSARIAETLDGPQPFLVEVLANLATGRPVDLDACLDAAREGAATRTAAEGPTQPPPRISHGARSRPTGPPANASTERASASRPTNLQTESSILPAAASRRMGPLGDASTPASPGADRPMDRAHPVRSAVRGTQLGDMAEPSVADRAGAADAGKVLSPERGAPEADIWIDVAALLEGQRGHERATLDPAEAALSDPPRLVALLVAADGDPVSRAGRFVAASADRALRAWIDAILPGFAARELVALDVLGAALRGGAEIELGLLRFAVLTAAGLHPQGGGVGAFAQRAITAVAPDADTRRRLARTAVDRLTAERPATAPAAAAQILAALRPVAGLADIVPMAEPSADAPLLTRAGGLVLLGAHLPTLFARMELVERGRFATRGAQIRAMDVLEDLLAAPLPRAGGTRPVQRLLCGLPLDEALPPPLPLSEAGHALTTSLLEAVIAQWTALGHTSPDGLRQAFLQRDGLLTRAAGGWRLQVTPAPFDMLLDRLPWSIAITKLPWMRVPIHVEWRK